MSAVELLEPILAGGVRAVNFFNGRLLTAQDLRREQDARHIGDWRLGQAIGAGVAYGLEVRKHANSTVQEPLVTVEAGLAVNREGQPLHLGSQISIALVRKAVPGAARDGDFGPCDTLSTGTYVAGPGVYLLTIAPASTKEGKALTSGFDQYGGKCNTDAIVETVQFRLIGIKASGLTVPAHDPHEESLYRSELAGLCFGAGDPAHSKLLGTAISDPVTKLAATALSNCDVPLALFYWTLNAGLRFIDQWAVRRTVIPRNADEVWVPLLAPRLRLDSEAFLRQFQAHLAELLKEPGIDPATLTADAALVWLPPVGVLPAGMNWRTFLGPMAPPSAKDTDAALLRGILHRALLLDAVPVPDYTLATQPGQAPVPLEVYRVPEAPDHVLFARSERGRVRVFLSPAVANADAVVTIRRDNPPIPVTASQIDQVFVAPDLEPGAHSVQVLAAGYAPETAAVAVCAGRTLEMSFTLRALPKGALLVVLKDENDDTRVIADANASVRAVAGSGTQFIAVLAADKKWHISDLAPGSYELIASAPGYQPESLTAAVVESEKTLEYTLKLAPMPEPTEDNRQCVVTNLVFVETGKRMKGIQLCPLLKQIRPLSSARELKLLIEKEGLSLVRLDASGERWLRKLGDYLVHAFRVPAEEASQPRVFLPGGETTGMRERWEIERSRRKPGATAIAVFGPYIVPLSYQPLREL